MIKHIFKGKNNKKQTDLIHTEIDGFLLKTSDFFTRMRQERLRSERYGTPLSLLIIDINSLINCLSEAKEVLLQSTPKQLVGVLKHSTRESDIKGWYEEGKVALLAPNTDGSGILALTRNLRKSIASRYSFNGAPSEEDIGQFITISCLPVGLSYFSNCSNEQEADTKLSLFQKYHTQDSSTLGLSIPISGPKGAAEVRALDWPLSFEVLSRDQLRHFEIKVKRLMDVLGSVLAIILCTPLMLIIAALIKLTSPGPVIFRQVRLGFLGRPFTFLKFRTMRVNCDDSLHQAYVSELIKGENECVNKGIAGRPLYKLSDDPRVTRLGKFLRKSSLDELPQFFNVLKGDMSLVGPRPPIPYECERYKPWHCGRVLEVRPGITGLWQVGGRSSTTFDEMVRLDLTYVRTWNLWLDLKIILKTFWAVISTKGGC